MNGVLRTGCYLLRINAACSGQNEESDKKTGASRNILLTGDYTSLYPYILMVRLTLPSETSKFTLPTS